MTDESVVARALGILPPLRDVTDPCPPRPAWEPPPVVFTEETFLARLTAAEGHACREGLRILRRLHPDDVAVGSAMAKLEQVG